MPRYAFVFMFFTLASVGLPGLSGFVGEFLVLLGTFKVNTWVAFLAATGLILGAAYALWLYRKIIFGELTKELAEGHPRHEPARGRGLPAAGAARPCGWASIPIPSSIRWRPRSTSWSATTRRRIKLARIASLAP